MLTKLENKVMLAVFNECKDKKSALINPLDLINFVGQDNLTQSKLEQTMSSLALDGYFDLIYSERKGEKIYCITLLNKGKAFIRSNEIMRRNLLFRLGVSLALAVFSFVIGLLLKAIF